MGEDQQVAYTGDMSGGDLQIPTGFSLDTAAGIMNFAQIDPQNIVTIAHLDLNTLNYNETIEATSEAANAATSLQEPDLYMQIHAQMMQQ